MRVKIAKHKLTNDNIMVYNKPKYVYIPLISGNDTDITILVNKGEYVYKGSIIGKRKGNLRIPLYASVSGTIIDFEERTCFNGTKVKCVMIENDFKEKIEKKISIKRNINKYTKEEFIDIIKENGIVGLGGAGFPAYLKYETDKKIKLLIINAVECEPYITADEALICSKCEEILEAIDAILEINHIDKAIIAIKNNLLKETFDNFIGTYLKITLKQVPNVYPMGWERSLIKEVTNKEYENIPSDIGIIVNNVSTIFAIYEALKFHKPLIERIVTFSGEGLKKPQNVLLKIGTPIIEILNELGFDNKNNIIAGGPMMGKEVIDDLVISANQNCILCLEDSHDDITNCLKCGQCISVCPVKLSPVLIMQAKDKNLASLEPNRCIECGLCSYICPAKLDVRNHVIEAKKTLRSEK